MKPRRGSLPRNPAADQKSAASDHGGDCTAAAAAAAACPAAAAACPAAAAAAACTDVLAGCLHFTFENASTVWRAMSKRGSSLPSPSPTLDMSWATEGSSVLQRRAISNAMMPVAPSAVASIVLPLPKKSRACKQKNAEVRKRRVKQNRNKTHKAIRQTHVQHMYNICTTYKK